MEACGEEDCKLAAVVGVIGTDESNNTCVGDIGVYDSEFIDWIVSRSAS